MVADEVYSAHRTGPVTTERRREQSLHTPQSRVNDTTPEHARSLPLSLNSLKSVTGERTLGGRTVEGSKIANEEVCAFESRDEDRRRTLERGAGTAASTRAARSSAGGPSAARITPWAMGFR
ncbi:hypothetical protein SKAU_G00186220 [Synaphobranchus kaupii]|uniref:Uncharacterized protein n=1 Tax=Synaphobranchus kaupii TaxID=118154 RepID=A0A9Q1FD52_SYNKA|nr:hypothetical protein SKAU_G00186220 [Synaphobranchus kaupii]